MRKIDEDDEGEMVRRNCGNGVKGRKGKYRRRERKKE